MGNRFPLGAMQRMLFCFQDIRDQIAGDELECECCHVRSVQAGDVGTGYYFQMRGYRRKYTENLDTLGKKNRFVFAVCWECMRLDAQTHGQDYLMGLAAPTG